MYRLVSSRVSRSGRLPKSDRKVRESYHVFYDNLQKPPLTVTDRSYIIDNGKVMREGTPRQLINDDLVRRTYLGHTFRGDEFDG